MVRDKPNPVLGDGVDNVAEENGTSEHCHCGSCWRRQFKGEVIATEARGLLSEKRESVVRFSGEGHREKHRP